MRFINFIVCLSLLNKFTGLLESDKCANIDMDTRTGITIIHFPERARYDDIYSINTFVHFTSHYLHTYCVLESKNWIYEITIRTFFVEYPSFFLRCFCLIASARRAREILPKR